MCFSGTVAIITLGGKVLAYHDLFQLIHATGLYHAGCMN